MIAFAPPTEDDIAHVAAHIRSIDALECRLIANASPAEAIEACLDRSDWALCARVDDEPQCIFGVTPEQSLLGDDGHPWMLGAYSLSRHARALLAHSRPYVDRMLESYQRLTNVVHADNRQAIRWLRWLGFAFKDPIDVKGHAFLPFEKGRSD